MMTTWFSGPPPKPYPPFPSIPAPLPTCGQLDPSPSMPRAATAGSSSARSATTQYGRVARPIPGRTSAPAPKTSRTFDPVAGADRQSRVAPVAASITQADHAPSRATQKGSACAPPAAISATAINPARTTADLLSPHTPRPFVPQARRAAEIPNASLTLIAGRSGRAAGPAHPRQPTISAVSSTA